MIRTLYTFPRLNDTNQTLYFDVRLTRFFIRSVVGDKITDTEINPATANVLMLWAQVGKLEEIKGKLS